MKQCHLYCSDVFHRSCVRCILGIPRTAQWHEHLSSAVLAQRAGLPHDISTLLREYRLRWLGHVARMPPSRTPKQVLFGERTDTRPRHGPRKRWRDVVAADTALLGVDDWYSAAQKRREWSALIKDIDPPPAQPTMFKCRCGREFRRSGDIKRHQRFCSH